MIDRSAGPGGAMTDGVKTLQSPLAQTLDPTIEVEIESDEPDEQEGTTNINPFTHGDNLAETLPDEKLSEVAQELCFKFKADEMSRKDWEQTYKDGLKLLGLKIEEVTKPWAGACNVVHPLLSEAVVKFQAETILETFPAAGPVKTKIIGAVTKEKEQAGARVSEDMNWRLTDQMTEYRQEHERLLWNLPIAGSAFKKVYYDAQLGRQVSMFVPAEDFIVAYGTADLQTAERYTHRMRKSENELDAMMGAGLYRKMPISDAPQGLNEDIHKQKDDISGLDGGQDDRHVILEFHCLMDIEDKGARPYVVTINKTDEQVLAIYRNWEEDDTLFRRRDYFVHYPYIVGFGFYGYGLIHLIGSHASAATSITRQLVDAGTLSNLPGGFKTRGLRVKGDDTPIAPGEFRDVDVPSGTLAENIQPLPYKEPSAVLFQLLQNIVEEGRRFASVSDATIADANQQAPVGTTLALLERTLKVMSAVQARVHAALKQEFKLLKEVIEQNMGDEYPYEVEPDKAVKKADYAIVEIIPVSDPNAATMSQRIMQTQAVMQLAQQDPQLYDKAEIHREMLSALGIKNAEKLLPSLEDQKPRDPISENMAVMMGKPVRAFAYQDHEAHMQTHQAFMQDPKLAMTLGQNPNAQMMFNAMQSHIAEHAAYAYRNQAQMMLGVELPDPNEAMPQEVEFQLSGLMAQAAQKVLQTNQAQAQQQQAQQQQQDPLVQIEQAKVKNAADTNAIKREDNQAKTALEAQRLQLEKMDKDRQFILEQIKLATEKQQKGTQNNIDLFKTRVESAHKDKDRHAQSMAKLNPPNKETK